MAADLYTDAYFEGPMAAWHRLSLPTFAAFLWQAVGGERPARILDLGCGDGAYGPVLAELGGAVDGCDGSEAALARARARGVYQRLVQADLAAPALPELSGPYELVFTTEVIEHLPDPDRFCRLAAGLLAPGGLLVLTTTTYHLYLFYYLLFAGPVRRRDLADFARGCLGDDEAGDRFVRTLWELTGGHEHGFRLRRLLACLRRAGFEIERRRYANVQPVFPLDGLDQPRFQDGRLRRMRPLLRFLGRGVNAFCRETGVYGANLMVAARMP